ncbi:inositol monophosphatase family protein [Aliiroseovarius sp.]|uniref:inositol monophosphatase family protein n=1 Tax=Aliiroseovarius sp. TaxID=1872442 RepID=UPI003BA881C3
MTPSPELTFATDLAEEAGRLAQGLRAEAPVDFVSVKGKMDFITHADQQVESLIRRRIAETYPDDAILGEEEGGGAAETFWVVDPIDGTTNYLKGLPDWGICIARVVAGQVTHGVISCPDQGRIAAAERGAGIRINGEKVAPRREASIALVQLGYSPRIDLGEHLTQIDQVVARGADYRRSGAACTGLLSVAAGWSDVFYEKHLNLWDAAAGLLLIAEAGGACLHDDLTSFARKGSGVLALGPAALDDGAAWKAIFPV